MYVPLFGFAIIYCALGEPDQAIAWLSKVYDERSSYITYLMTDPQLDPLRADPRFTQLPKKVGLDPRRSGDEIIAGVTVGAARRAGTPAPPGAEGALCIR